MNIYFYLRIN